MATNAQMVEEIKRGRRVSPSTKQKVIAVCTPTLGMVSMWWHTAISDLVWPMNTGKALIPMIDQKGGEIAEVRNRLVSLVLAYEEADRIEVEGLMWIDDDVIVNRAAMLALVSHDRDIASGVYFSKTDPGSQPLIFAGPCAGTVPFVPDTVFEAWGWAQGLCYIRTNVYRRMRDELNLGTDKYGNPSWYKIPDLALNEHGGITTGGTEDFVCFHHAADLGIVPLIDCTRCAFGWHYDANEKVGYPRKQWDQFWHRQPVVWDHLETPVVWE